MNKIKETLSAMVEAAKYSFSFCYRNCKNETRWRIFLVFATTFLAYSSVNATGHVMNKIQHLVTSKTRPASFVEFITGDMKWSIIFFLSIPLINVIVGRFNWYYKSKWNQLLRYANTRELNDHRATLDIATFRSKKFDDLTRRISELPTGWQTRIWFSDEVFNLVATIISFVLFGASLVWYKPIYAVILFITALPMAAAEFRYVGMWWNLFQELVPINKSRNVMERAFHQTTAFVQAKMFGQQKALRKEIDQNVSEILAKNEVIRRKGVKNELVSYSFSQIGFCCVILHAIWQAVVNRTEIGTLTVIIAAAKTFQGSLEAIVSHVADQWNAVKGVSLIEKEFFGTKSSLLTPYPVVPRFDIVPTIKFADVCFKYPDKDNEVLKGVSFEIKPCTKVAIVGQSGHGKSTLAALLTRQYDPNSGSILIDDVNLHNIEPSVLCNIVSALTQEYTILERPICREIASSRLGEPVDMNRVIEASRFACFDEVARSRVNGYDAQIGTEYGGEEFSGGEKQRLALARFYYKGTPVLILDEPDSKLDPKSANQVIENIFNLTGVTVVIITHHISRAERCDKVILMKDGRVVEQGSPSELRALNGHYTSMLASDRAKRGEKTSGT